MHKQTAAQAYIGISEHPQWQSVLVSRTAGSPLSLSLVIWGHSSHQLHEAPVKFQALSSLKRTAGLDVGRSGESGPVPWLS